MGREQLGEFEEIVLLTVGVLHGNAYGGNIKTEIERRLKREVAVGALQVTLRRLETKGCLVSKRGEVDALRGGRPRVYFTITVYGKRALEQTLEDRISLWKALPDVVLKMS